MKRFLMFAVTLLLVFFAGLVGGWFYLRSLLTEGFVVRQLESSLNARVEVRELDIDLFSVISSIELEGLKLAPRDALANKGVPLAERPPIQNPLIAAESVELALSFLPLLSRRFEIQRFVIDRPEIKLVQYQGGNTNLSPLFGPPQIVDGQPNPVLQQEQSTEAQPAPAGQEEPFTIKTLPVSAGLERIGIQNGTLHMSFPAQGHRLLLGDLNLALTDFDVDPGDLHKHNQALLTLNTNMRVFGRSGKESALLILRSGGTLRLFEPDTGVINPDLVYALRLLKGSYINNMSLMRQLSGGMPALVRAGIQMQSIAERADLTADVDLKVRYKNGRVTLLEQVVFPTVNYDLLLKPESWLLVTATAHNFQGRILASQAESGRSIEQVDAAVTRNVPGEDPAQYRKILLGGLLQGDRIALDFISTGPLGQPQIYLKTQIPSLADVIKDSAKTAIKNQIQKKLQEELGKEAGKAVQDGLNKLLKPN